MLQHRDVAFLTLLAVMSVGGLVFLIATWRDSLRSIRESLSPFRLLSRPRFSILDTLWVILIAAVALKLAMTWQLSASNWLENAGLFIAALTIISLVAAFARIATGDFIERRQRLKVNSKIEPPKFDSADEVQRNSKRGTSDTDAETPAIKLRR